MRGKLQHAADEAEKYGDTKTQFYVKKMQYPGATGTPYGGKSTDTSLYPLDAKIQIERTEKRAKHGGKRYGKK